MARKELIEDMIRLASRLGYDTMKLKAFMFAETGHEKTDWMSEEELTKVCTKLQARVTSQNKELETLEGELGEIQSKGDEWEEVEPELPNIWLPGNEGEELIGTIASMDEGEYGIFAMIDKGEGEAIQTPAHTYLQSRLKNCKEGDVVRIVFKGEIKQKGKRATRDYGVFRRRSAEEVE